MDKDAGTSPGAALRDLAQELLKFQRTWSEYHEAGAANEWKYTKRLRSLLRLTREADAVLARHQIAIIDTWGHRVVREYDSLKPRINEARRFVEQRTGVAQMYAAAMCHLASNHVAFLGVLREKIHEVVIRGIEFPPSLRALYERQLQRSRIAQAAFAIGTVVGIVGMIPYPSVALPAGFVGLALLLVDRYLRPLSGISVPKALAEQATAEVRALESHVSAVTDFADKLGAIQLRWPDFVEPTWARFAKGEEIGEDELGRECDRVADLASSLTNVMGAIL